MSLPLQLNNYFFPVISVIANPKYDPEAAKQKGLPKLECKVETKVSNDSENEFQVQLDININDTDEAPSQYIVNLKAFGYFTTNSDMPDKFQVVGVTGASILYSASRDFLLTIMSRGPWPPIILNLLSFNPIKAQESQPAQPVQNIKKQKRSSNKTET